MKKLNTGIWHDFADLYLSSKDTCIHGVYYRSKAREYVNKVASIDRLFLIIKEVIRV